MPGDVVLIGAILIILLLLEIVYRPWADQQDANAYWFPEEPSTSKRKRR